MKVLVVKADEGHASCLSTFLKQLGDDVMTATDCLSALRVAAAFRPDVVFTGLTLPRLDGWELTRRLRTMPALARTRIYALTAWNCDEAILESQAAGMDYHFAVPALLESWLLVHEAQAISPRQAEQAAFSLAQQVVLECFARKGSDNRFCNRKYLLAKCACTAGSPTSSGPRTSASSGGPNGWRMAKSRRTERSPSRPWNGTFTATSGSACSRSREASSTCSPSSATAPTTRKQRPWPSW